MQEYTPKSNLYVKYCESYKAFTNRLTADGHIGGHLGFLKLLKDENVTPPGYHYGHPTDE